MDELVTILTGSQAQQLAIAKTYLEDHDIICEVAGDLLPYLPAMANSIQLKVAASQIEEAMKLLIEGGFATADDFKADESIKKIGGIIDKVISFFKGK